jgi:hypothetical protein
MSDVRLVPSSEHVSAIVAETESFLDFLRDASLIASQRKPLVPAATIAYRKVHAAYRWFDWERVLNPDRVPLGGPPIGTEAGGWPDWRALHLALVDLQSARHTIIDEWGLGPLVGASSIQFSIEARGAPGSGEKTLVVAASRDPSSDRSDEVRLEKPLDWPPPLPRAWRNQCRYAVKRIRTVMEKHMKQSGPPAIRPEPSPMGSDSQLVASALIALGELVDACSRYQLVGAENRRSP